MVQLQSRILFCLLCFVFSVKLIAQNTDSIGTNLLLSLPDDELLNEDNVAESIDNLENLKRNKINLNNAVFSDLEQLSFLSDFQLKSLWKYISQNRPLLTIYEITLVPGFDARDLERLKPFIVVEPLTKKSYAILKHEMIVESRIGFNQFNDSSMSYLPSLGNNVKTAIQFKSNISNWLKLKLFAENDVGESYDLKHFDFYSGSVIIEKKGFIKKAIIGDYSCRFGQGMVLWNGTAISNFSNINIRKRSTGISDYKGLNENSYFRGIALTLGRKNVEVSLFLSHHGVDASVDSLTNTISSFAESGYHRTESELQKKHAVKYSMTGLNISQRFKICNVGFTHVSHFFDKEIAASPALYNYFIATGRYFSYSGAYLFCNLKKIDFFAETGINNNFKKVLYFGSEVQLVNNIQVASYYKITENGYQARYITNLATAGSKELFWSVQYNVDTNWTFACSQSLMKSLWLTYRFDGLTWQNRLQCSVIRKIQSTASVGCFLNRNFKPISIVDSSMQTSFVNNKAFYNIKMYCQFRIQTQWNFISQFQSNYEKTDSKQGIYFAQDVEYDVNQLMSFALRYAVFDAPFSQKIYSYEPEGRYGLINGFYGEGERFFLKTNLQLMHDKLHVSFKYSYSSQFYNQKTLCRNGFSFYVRALF